MAQRVGAIWQGYFQVCLYALRTWAYYMQKNEDELCLLSEQTAKVGLAFAKTSSPSAAHNLLLAYLCIFFPSTLTTQTTLVATTLQRFDQNGKLKMKL
jgi:hypothetical protein